MAPHAGPEPATACPFTETSKLKKTSLAADLTDKEKHVVVAFANACTDCNSAETVDDMLADNMTWVDVQELSQRTGLPLKTVKGVLGSSDAREWFNVPARALMAAGARYR